MSKFKVGDKVRVVDAPEFNTALQNGSLCTVSGYNGLGNVLLSEDEFERGYHEFRFEKVVETPARNLYVRHRPAGKDSDRYTDVKPVDSIAEGAAYVTSEGVAVGVYEIVEYATVATFEVRCKFSREVIALP
jgi:hypothetical protein